MSSAFGIGQAIGQIFMIVGIILAAIILLLLLFSFIPICIMSGIRSDIKKILERIELTDNPIIKVNEKQSNIDMQLTEEFNLKNNGGK